MRLLAFDLGGSGGQLFYGDFHGDTLSIGSVAKMQNSPVPMGCGLYWDAVGCYNRLLEGLNRACAMGRVDSLGIDSFCNDFGLLGGEDELLTQVRCYRDERTVRHEGYVYSRVAKRRLYMMTGNQNAWFNTLLQLGAMRSAGLEWLLERVRTLLFLPDLFAFFLTGQMATEYTLASVSQMFDPTAMDWHEELLGVAGLRRDQLAPLSMPGNVVGKIRESLAVERGIQRFPLVSVCEHDTGSAFVASPFTGDDHAILSSGTWAIIGTTLKQPLMTEAGFLHNLANEGGLPGYQRFLRNVMGLWILQQLREDCQIRGKGLSFGELESAAAAATPFSFYVDVDDESFFSPGNMGEKIRAYCQSRYHRAPETIGEIARCVYEGLAFKYRWNLEILEEVTGKRFRFINILGGGCRDSFMCQCAANACNLPVAIGPMEATALGNLAVQLMSMGAVASIGEAKELLARSFPPEWREPDEAVAWEAHYAAYREAVGKPGEALT